MDWMVRSFIEKGNMKMIVEVLSNIALVRSTRSQAVSSWQKYGKVVWRDAEPSHPGRTVTEVLVSPGTYHLVKRTNPFRFSGEWWWMVEGRDTGAPESYWKKLLTTGSVRKVPSVEGGQGQSTRLAVVSEYRKAA